MSNDNRTSLRLNDTRLKKLKALKDAWRMPSQDETLGFLIDVADPEKFGDAAKKHIARIRVAEQREKQRKAQVEKAMANLSEEQIAKLISGELQV